MEYKQSSFNKSVLVVVFVGRKLPTKVMSFFINVTKCQYLLRVCFHSKVHNIIVHIRELPPASSTSDT